MDDKKLQETLLALTAMSVQSMERTTQLAKLVALAVPNLPQAEKEQLLSAIAIDEANLEQVKALLKNFQTS